MSQEGDERSKRVECEDVGPTESGGKIAGWTGAVLFFGAIAAYYVAAFLFAVWSWLALFGRVRTRAAEFGLVIWMAFIVAIFHFAGVLVKPWLICVVDRVVDWLRSLGRRNRMGRGQWVVEWDDEGVRCSGPEGEVESAGPPCRPCGCSRRTGGRGSMTSSTCSRGLRDSARCQARPWGRRP
jgi:hypothetical protein